MQATVPILNAPHVYPVNWENMLKVEKSKSHISRRGKSDLPPEAGRVRKRLSLSSASFAIRKFFSGRRRGSSPSTPRHSLSPGKLRKNSKQDELTKAFDEVSENNRVETQEGWNYLTSPKDRKMKKMRRKQIRPFVEHALRRTPIGLSADFRQMKRSNDPSKMTEFVSQIPHGKNRYKDVGCLDNNRVVLKIGSCSYIHANFVASPNNPRRFICTQGPLQTTCSEFWCMVVQEEAEVILMLCNLTEKRESKCAVYYPTKEDEFLTFQGGVSVKFRDREELSFPFNTKTKVEVTYLEVTIMGHAPQMCKHYHWIDWPDRGVPEADLAPLYLLYQVRSVRTPIVIHCSAGIGRTGTMVLIENAMEILERGEQLEKMDGYLQQLRAQRNNCIQTDQQYLFVHQVLLNFLREAGWLPQRLNSRLKDFTEHYLRLTRKP
ncbi:hypothetical protein RB195_015331 [Necator americanus]|uniref:Protein-tyrosine phosphatase n=1 Tax=Necator americanus TaxID=51031 RepID=A0ABR1E423_NECAM